MSLGEPNNLLSKMVGIMVLQKEQLYLIQQHKLKKILVTQNTTPNRSKAGGIFQMQREGR